MCCVSNQIGLARWQSNSRKPVFPSLKNECERKFRMNFHIRGTGNRGERGLGWHSATSLLKVLPTKKVVPFDWKVVWMFPTRIPSRIFLENFLENSKSTGWTYMKKIISKITLWMSLNQGVQGSSPWSRTWKSLFLQTLELRGRRFFCARNGGFARFPCLRPQKDKERQGEKKICTGNKNVARISARTRREQNKKSK